MGQVLAQRSVKRAHQVKPPRSERSCALRRPRTPRSALIQNACAQSGRMPPRRRQQQATPVEQTPVHGVPRIDVFGNGELLEVGGRDDLHLARPDVLLADQPARTAPVVALGVRIDQRRDRKSPAHMFLEQGPLRLGAIFRSAESAHPVRRFRLRRGEGECHVPGGPWSLACLAEGGAAEALRLWPQPRIPELRSCQRCMCRGGAIRLQNLAASHRPSSRFAGLAATDPPFRSALKASTMNP